MSATAEPLPGSRAKRADPLLARAVRALTRLPLHVFFIGIALFWMTPTIGLLITSFRPAAANSSSGWWTVFWRPRQLTLEPYEDLLEDPQILQALWNTVLITVPTSVLLVLVASLSAYALTWMEFPGREALFLVIVALLVVPLQMALIPVARLYGLFGIFDTVYAAILFHIAFGLPFAIFLLRNFFIGLPHDLLESARIDGASEWQIFSRIVLPLGMPAVASLVIFQFLWTWNDLLVGLVFAPGSAAPITVYIRELLRQFGTNLDIIAPATFISMITPLIVFFAFQRYFVQGLLAGSLK